MVNQQDTEKMEELDDAGKMTSKTEQAMMAYLEVLVVPAVEDYHEKWS
jgi:hypothetical protein